MRVAINGFGRIGRLTLRAALEARRGGFSFVAINDLGDARTNAHLLNYDSTHGRPPFEVRQGDDYIEAAGHKIECLSERDPARLPWGEMGIDLVLECTGLFTAREKAVGHLKAGAKRVLVSGPSGDADTMVVYGVNHESILAEHEIISNASCTTNCLAPVAMILDEVCGIEQGHMTTIHSYTGDQPVLDIAHSDLRRARAAGLSMIPTSTGAAKAIGMVLPALDGKIVGTSIRVPTPNVSLVDLVVHVKRGTSIDEVNRAFEAASSNRLRGIVEVSDLPLVSSDFNHCAASAVIDVAQTNVVDDVLVRVLSWYDNEWGFANRMVDVAERMGELIAR